MNVVSFMAPGRMRTVLLAFAVAAASATSAEDAACASTYPVTFLQTAVDVTRQDQAPGGKKGVQVRVKTTNITKFDEDLGISMNQAGDRMVFITSLLMYTPAAAVLWIAFSVLRRLFPTVYENNRKEVPIEVGDGFFSWVSASLAMTPEIASQVASLDVAMMIEYCDLTYKMCFAIGIPYMLLMCPQYYFFGGGAAGRAENPLGAIGMSNVTVGTNNYLFFVIGLVVVPAVNYYIVSKLFEAQKKFLSFRFKWLHEISNPRASTVLVEAIPPAYRSEEKLLEFFERVAGKGSVETVATVKNAEKLGQLVAHLKDAKEHLALAEAKWEKKGKAADHRPTHSPSFLSSEKVDSITFYGGEVERLGKEVAAEKAEVLEKSKTPGEMNLGVAFVTFKDIKDADIAQTLVYSADRSEWKVEVPPAANDVRWEDLKEDPSSAVFHRITGYTFLTLLFLIFTPSVVLITNVAANIKLGSGVFEYCWECLAPTFGLTVFMMLLPTIQRSIFSSFFNLKAEAWSQKKLQDWGFAFQFIFVILVTALTNNIVIVVQQIISQPFSIFSILADNMPNATHFYMNFVVLGWVTDSLPLLRMVQLFKYLSYRTVWSEEEAKKRAEPENQDSYGMGNRSAHFVINMAIAVVFGTLSSYMYVLVGVDMFVCRIACGWTCVFAETKKTDLGGPFWVSSLHQTFIMLVVYNLLMAGVLFQRAISDIPAVGPVVSLVALVVAWVRFSEQFSWEILPFSEVKDKISKTIPNQTYIQPELKGALELGETKA